MKYYKNGLEKKDINLRIRITSRRESPGSTYSLYSQSVYTVNKSNQNLCISFAHAVFDNNFECFYSLNQKF